MLTYLTIAHRIGTIFAAIKASEPARTILISREQFIRTQWFNFEVHDGIILGPEKYVMEVITILVE